MSKKIVAKENSFEFEQKKLIEYVVVTDLDQLYAHLSVGLVVVVDNVAPKAEEAVHLLVSLDLENITPGAPFGLSTNRIRNAKVMGQISGYLLGETGRDGRFTFAKFPLLSSEIFLLLSGIETSYIDIKIAEEYVTVEALTPVYPDMKSLKIVFDGNRKEAHKHASELASMVLSKTKNQLDIFVNGDLWKMNLSGVDCIFGDKFTEDGYPIHIEALLTFDHTVEKFSYPGEENV